MGQLESRCTLEFYRDLAGEMFDTTNTIPYAFFYLEYQYLMFLALFFKNLTSDAAFVKYVYFGIRNMYLAHGNYMYSQQELWNMFNFGLFGIGFYPGEWRCWVYLVYHEVLQWFSFLVLGDMWTSWWGNKIPDEFKTDEEIKAEKIAEIENS